MAPCLFTLYKDFYCQILIFRPLPAWGQQSAPPPNSCNQDSCCQQGALISWAWQGRAALPRSCGLLFSPLKSGTNQRGRALTLQPVWRQERAVFASPALLALSGVTFKDLSLECALLLMLVGNSRLYVF